MSLPGRLVLASASYWSVQAVQPVALAIFDKKSAFLPSRTCRTNLILVELKGNPLQFNLAAQKLDSHVWLASDKDCDPSDGSTPFELP